MLAIFSDVMNIATRTDLPKVPAAPEAPARRRGWLRWRLRHIV
ncbi:hypothetical protein [Halovulum dunhuangense]|nr:hypothetical protein [Halovulum dunhuangense]